MTRTEKMYIKAKNTEYADKIVTKVLITIISICLVSGVIGLVWCNNAHKARDQILANYEAEPRIQFKNDLTSYGRNNPIPETESFKFEGEDEKITTKTISTQLDPIDLPFDLSSWLIGEDIDMTHGAGCRGIDDGYTFVTYKLPKVAYCTLPDGHVASYQWEVTIEDSDNNHNATIEALNAKIERHGIFAKYAFLSSGVLAVIAAFLQIIFALVARHYYNRSVR